MLEIDISDFWSCLTALEQLYLYFLIYETNILILYETNIRINSRKGNL